MDNEKKQVKTRCWTKVLLFLILSIHVALLAWSGYRHSPIFNEGGHLASGLYHLQTGRFDSFQVNPPLVRMIAAIPIAVIVPEQDWSFIQQDPHSRNEYQAGKCFYGANEEKAIFYTILARSACIPFSVLGAFICWLWAKELFGYQSGLIALCLWCFSPMILGHASLVTADAHSAAIGIASFYLFWRWLKKPSWASSFTSGIVLGLAQLCKTTLLIFYPIFIFVWGLALVFQKPAYKKVKGQRSVQFLFLLVLSVYVINAGYLFEGSMTSIGDYFFKSALLSGNHAGYSSERLGGNRFSNTMFAKFPVPLPKDYLLGIDLQQIDFENGKRCYLLGEWKEGQGWWYFYLVAIAVKTPLAIFGMFVLAFTYFFKDFHNAKWINEACLVLLPLSLLVIVSSQTRMTIHYRYLLPAFPFLFIWISRIGKQMHQWNVQNVAVVFLLFFFIGSSIYNVPHSLSFFNMGVGGSLHGHKYLLDSNIAWNQDLILLKEWYDAHPESRPFYIATIGLVDPAVMGFAKPPKTNMFRPGNLQKSSLIGWYAVDINLVYGSSYPIQEEFWNPFFPKQREALAWFQKLSPVARIGNSFLLFYISEKAANEMIQNRSLALPPSLIQIGS